MKAKKIIAIGLVAIMTLGMSTSVFARDTNYDDYPQFDGWDGQYGPNDNVFHAGGTGWLESGTGINESVTNVIVPTMPNIKYNYGDPGPYDFGIDPQRLVDRTDAGKYVGKMDFTDGAKENGVYFLNGADDNEALNKFDNKSIKLEGTNIGTTPVAFTVKATMAGGENFECLEEDPSFALTAQDVFAILYLEVGETWENYVTTHPESPADPYYEDPNELDFATDLLNPDLPYSFAQDVFSEEEMGLIADAVATEYEAVPQPLTATAVLEVAVGYAEGDNAKFLDKLGEYRQIEEDPEEPTGVGMYLGLNTALGDEDSDDDDYEEAAEEKPLRPIVGGTIQAEATATLVVEGTPGNYDMIYDEGLKDYRKAIREYDPDDPTSEPLDPFKTAAFWFRGVATKNDVVPEGVTIPALDFTWTFSKEIPVMPAKLVSINGQNVPNNFDGVLTDAKWDDEGYIVLEFNREMKRIDKSRTAPDDNPSWAKYVDANVYTINGNKITVNARYYMGAVDGNRYWRVVFPGADPEQENEYLYLTFVKPN